MIQIVVTSEFLEAGVSYEAVGVMYIQKCRGGRGKGVRYTVPAVECVEWFSQETGQYNERYPDHVARHSIKSIRMKSPGQGPGGSRVLIGGGMSGRRHWAGYAPSIY